MIGRAYRVLVLVAGVGLVISCTEAPVKRYYTLNYVPSEPQTRQQQGPYPYVIRVRDLTIEDAYARPQIVYRKSPFELEYYFYRVWAVKPTQMITDLVQQHLVAAKLASSVVRRYDEGRAPQYELGGMIEAIEEYDSDKIWFAHLSLNLRLTRISDGKIIYARRFDNRKRVFQNQPEYVVKEMSSICEYILSQAMQDLDLVLAKESGMTVKAPATADVDTTRDTPDLWKK